MTVTWTLDEPLVIEEAGTLWVGYQASPPEGVDGTISCMAGCTDEVTPSNAWQWQMDSEAFELNTESAHASVRVTIGSPKERNVR
jgi:hypothetical protein